MSNSPNMNLPVPTASITDGPEWASDIENSLDIIDSHTHNPGSGVPITPSGLNINTDLLINSNNLTLVNSVEFSTSAGTPSLTSIYADGTNLYYKDGNGNAIQITSGGNVNAGAGSITGLPSGTAGVAYTALSGTYTFTQATSTAANIDAATLIVRYPGSYPTPSGNFIAIQAPSALATGYSLTLPLSPPASSNYLMIMDSSGVISTLSTDNTTITVGGNTLHVVSGGINTTQLADSSVTAAKLHSDAVTTVKILDSNVTSAKIQTNINLPGTDVTANSKSLVTMAANTTANFGIVRGVVNINGTTITAGEQFTPSRPATGVYHVDYTVPYGAEPAVVVIPYGTQTVANIAASSTTGFVVDFFNLSGVATNTAFSFITIGP